LKTMVYVWFTESKHRVSNPVPLSHPCHTVPVTADIPAKLEFTAKATSEGVKLSIKKTEGADGYRIYMSTKPTSEFKSIKTKAITGAYNYTKKGMEKGTTYYFKVRSYKVVDERKCGVSTVKLFLYIDILHSDKGGA